MSLKKYSKLPCHIVEDHNDALRPILRALATKHLPFHKNLFIHFDSHPDLLIPAELRPDEIFQKETLFERISIENWIMPSVYAGHIDTIVWIKPPWANQIKDGVYQFYTGIEKVSGTVKVSSDLLYFVSEMLYCAEENLECKKNVILHVITIGQTSNFRDVPGLVAPTNSSKGNQKQDMNLKSSFSSSGIYHSICETVKKLLAEHNELFVLDIDLDFFTTRNPFIDTYKDVDMYERLKVLYKFELDFSNNKTVEDNQIRRKKQMQPLMKFFQNLNDLENPKEGLPGLLQEITNQDDRATLESLVNDLLDNVNEKVDWLLVHDAGCTFDSNEQVLPHHPSSDDEIRTLMHDATTFLDQFSPPTIVTMARSSLDGYCPADKVDFVQEMMCGYLRSKQAGIERLPVATTSRDSPILEAFRQLVSTNNSTPSRVAALGLLRTI